MNRVVAASCLVPVKQRDLVFSVTCPANMANYVVPQDVAVSLRPWCMLVEGALRQQAPGVWTLSLLDTYMCTDVADAVTFVSLYHGLRFHCKPTASFAAAAATSAPGTTTPQIPNALQISIDTRHLSREHAPWLTTEVWSQDTQSAAYVARLHAVISIMASSSFADNHSMTQLLRRCTRRQEYPMACRPSCNTWSGAGAVANMMAAATATLWHQHGHAHYHQGFGKK